MARRIPVTEHALAKQKEAFIVKKLNRGYNIAHIQKHTNVLPSLIEKIQKEHGIKFTGTYLPPPLLRYIRALIKKKKNDAQIWATIRKLQDDHHARNPENKGKEFPKSARVSKDTIAKIRNDTWGSAENKPIHAKDPPIREPHVQKQALELKSALEQIPPEKITPAVHRTITFAIKAIQEINDAKTADEKLLKQSTHWTPEQLQTHRRLTAQIEQGTSQFQLNLEWLKRNAFK